MSDTAGTTTKQTDIDGTIKDFWSTRPQRPRSGRKIAGVATAIGYRYGIDPIVIRVVFVAITVFGGVGPLLYVLGWLFLPEENDETSAAEALAKQGQSSVSTGLTIVLLLSLFPLTALAFSGGWFGEGGWFDGGGLIAIVLICGALYFMHRERGHMNYSAPKAAAETTSDNSSTIDEAPDDPSLSPATTPVANPTAEPVSDLSSSSPTAVKSGKPRSRVGLITLGVTLLMAGVGIALGLSGYSWFSPEHVIGVLLGILGIGMVIGAFVCSGRKLILLVIPLVLVGLPLTIVPSGNFSGGVGDLTVTPHNATELKPVYQRMAGSVSVDLSELSVNAPLSTEVRTGVGDTTVIVPKEANVDFHCEVGAGTTDCLGQSTEGIGIAPITGRIPGVDASNNGGEDSAWLTLKVTNGAGTVEVRRG